MTCSFDPDRPRCFSTQPLKDGTRRRRYRRRNGEMFTTIELPIEELQALRLKVYRFEQLRALLSQELTT